jgi:hypothetical protein
VQQHRVATGSIDQCVDRRPGGPSDNVGVGPERAAGIWPVESDGRDCTSSIALVRETAPVPVPSCSIIIEKPEEDRSS